MGGPICIDLGIFFLVRVRRSAKLISRISEPCIIPVMEGAALRSSMRGECAVHPPASTARSKSEIEMSEEILGSVLQRHEEYCAPHHPLDPRHNPLPGLLPSLLVLLLPVARNEGPGFRVDGGFVRVCGRRRDDATSLWLDQPRYGARHLMTSQESAVGLLRFIFFRWVRYCTFASIGNPVHPNSGSLRGHTR